MWVAQGLGIVTNKILKNQTMKKLIQLLVVVLIAGFVLPSCNSSLSITKRRYNKGYYVHHSGKHQVKKQQNDVARNETKAAPSQEEFRAIEFVKRPGENALSPEKKEVITAAASKAQTYTREQKKEMRAEAVDLAVKHPVKAIKRVGELTSKQDSGDKALSLLWVVVVVLLIVYLLGILLNWAGGAGWIHILAIIALVLLILWLLRIL